MENIIETIKPKDESGELKVLSTAFTNIVPEEDKKVLEEVVTGNNDVAKAADCGLKFEKWVPELVEGSLDGVPVERKRVDIPTTKGILG